MDVLAVAEEDLDVFVEEDWGLLAEGQVGRDVLVALPGD